MVSSIRPARCRFCPILYVVVVLVTAALLMEISHAIQSSYEIFRDPRAQVAAALVK